MINIPTNLPQEEHDLLIKLLAVHLAYPLPYPLSGAYFEELFAHVIGGEREPRKLLFDVLRGQTGWSLKTGQLSRAKIAPNETFEVVLQRCDILKDRRLSLSDPVDILGQSVINHFGSFFEKSLAAQKVADLRLGFLLRDRAYNRFAFFQQPYRFYTPEQVVWRWANSEERSLMGYVNGELVLRWYRSGTQLFGVYRIPGDVNIFHIAWKRANLDETVAFFSSRGNTVITDVNGKQLEIAF